MTLINSKCKSIMCQFKNFNEKLQEPVNINSPVFLFFFWLDKCKSLMSLFRFARSSMLFISQDKLNSHLTSNAANSFVFFFSVVVFIVKGEKLFMF